MGSNCASLVADVLSFCYERDFMLSLSDDNRFEVIEAFSSTLRYLGDLLNIDNNLFDSMVNHIYPSELQLNKTNVSDDFDFDIVSFPFLDGDGPRSTSYGVYLSQLIHFALVPSDFDDFFTRNKVLTAKLLRQGYRCHKLRQPFSNFYRWHFDLLSKYNVVLKTLLLQGLS